MRFSISKLLVGTGFLCLFLALSFAIPQPIGFYIQTGISLFVLPPILIVGVVNTRGLRQAFFLGSMFAGFAHFCYCLTKMVTLSWGIFDGSAVFEVEELDRTEAFMISITHFVGIGAGIIGGITGMLAYRFIVDPDEQPPVTEGMLENSDKPT